MDDVLKSGLDAVSGSHEQIKDRFRELGLNEEHWHCFEMARHAIEGREALRYHRRRFEEARDRLLSRLKKRTLDEIEPMLDEGKEFAVSFGQEVAVYIGALKEAAQKHA